MNEKKHTKRESEYFYTNKFNEKQLRFSPKQDEVVVTLQSQASDETLDEVSRSTSLDIKEHNLRREFAVLKVPSERNLETASESLDAEDNIANTIPVMVDDEGLTRYFLPDECTVQFQEEVSTEDAKRIIEEIGSSIIVKQRTAGYYTIAILEGKGLFETIRQLSELDEVLFAEPSEFGLNDALAYIPDDPDFERLWGLRNTGQTLKGTTGTPGADIRATEAWDISMGNHNVIITVLDSGADLDHPDLQANILPRNGQDWDFADSDSVPDDEAGRTHGTHVLGTIGGVDNTTGVIGVAPKCRLMPLRINLSKGMNANRADAIHYVADQAVANPGRRYVMNCSWKMSGDNTAIHNAIIRAVNNNVVVVFAAGNDNNNIHYKPLYPAVFPEVIAVAAIDQNDSKYRRSNYGREVDVSAPGVNIWSTMGRGRYDYKNGTSMASPHVAGLAALIWSKDPSLTNHKVRQIIESTCDNIDAANPGFSGKLGKGRINALRALSV